MKIILFAGLLLLCFSITTSGCQNQQAQAMEPDVVETQSAGFLSLYDSVKPSAVNKENEGKEDQAGVWICKSSGATKYHYNEDCGGLNRCTHKIEKTTVRQAEAVGLTACSYKKCR